MAMTTEFRMPSQCDPLLRGRPGEPCLDLVRDQPDPLGRVAELAGVLVPPDLGVQRAERLEVIGVVHREPHTERFHLPRASLGEQPSSAAAATAET